MKPFTQAILLLGIVTLIFYALNPLEPFDTLAATQCVPDPNHPGSQICGTSSPTTPPPPPKLDFSSILNQYKKMTPDQQAALQAQVRYQRNQLGLVDTGFFSDGLHPELNQQLPEAPKTQSSRQPEAPVMDDSSSQTQARAQTQTQIKDSESPATLSDIQGLINAQVQSQLANQPIANCGLSKTYSDSPNFNDILRMADEQRAQQESKQQVKESHCEAKKKKINRQQATYRPTPQSCPPPDPSVWIKRNEIPCWNCKV
jgi:hypothetical protein